MQKGASPVPAVLLVFLSMLLISGCATSAQTAEDNGIRCESEHCEAVAKPLDIEPAEQESPVYTLGPHLTFSLHADPQIVRHSPTSLIVELGGDRVLVGVLMNGQDFGLEKSADITVADLFGWYFIKPFSEAVQGGLPSEALENVKAFKQVFELQEVEKFHYFERGSLTVFSFLSPSESVHRVYAVSREAPESGYMIDLRGFTNEEVEFLLQRIDHN